MQSEHTLDISPIKASIDALSKSVCVYNANLSVADVDLKNTLRSGVIQNFETAYELCWKFMKRWLEINISPNIVDGVTRKEFYRIARQNGLIADVDAWWDFHSARNRTSHTYSATAAADVLTAALNFLAPAQNFAAFLETRV